MTYVIGVDPGQTTGVFGLDIPDDPENTLVCNSVYDAAQCWPYTTFALLNGLMWREPTLLAIEWFVVGPRAAHANSPKAGNITRDLVTECRAWAEERALPYVERRAVDVKAWATDQRLSAAGLLEPTKGMTHARDAARHALYAAVKDCGLRDPLSRKGGNGAGA